MSDLSKLCARLGDQAAPIVRGRSLAELNGCHVELRCACGRAVIPAVVLLIRMFGPARRLAEIVDRATCQQCGGRIARAWLNETHHRLPGTGSEPGWSVQILPVPIPRDEAAE